MSIDNIFFIMPQNAHETCKDQHVYNTQIVD